MHIIARKTIAVFWEIHSDSKQPLLTWFKVVKSAQWQSPSDIKDVFSTASFLQNNRVCFNIKGNDYRLIVKVLYELGRVYIRFIGTHQEYDKIDVNSI
jgi:mRNA interferase HigB